MSISELKHVSEPARRIEVFTGHGRRRTWSAEDKLAIVAESYDPGASVCNVARRHGLTPQQLFTWRRVARRQADGAVRPAFVPAVVTPEPVPTKEPKIVKPTTKRRSRRRGSTIEVEASGVTVRIADGASASTITAVIGALKASP